MVAASQPALHKSFVFADSNSACLQDPDFPALSGARVVRIAVHPELNGTGYGSR
jgi:tRNA(Met) C34 N-acetyltransferase TmcA